MKREYRHLRVLRAKLEAAADAETCAAILDGMDDIRDTSNPAKKVRWANEMMARMERSLDSDTCISVREQCACLVSNESSVYAKTFRRLRKQYADDGLYLQAVIDYLNATAPLRRCGEVSAEDGRITTVIARNRCDCQGIAKGAIRPVSTTWCQCCKGCIRSVLRYIFPDRACEMVIRETYASGGETCTFTATFADDA